MLLIFLLTCRIWWFLEKCLEIFFYGKILQFFLMPLFLPLKNKNIGASIIHLQFLQDGGLSMTI